VQASIEEVFADDAEFLSELEQIRGASREAARFVKKLRASAGLTQRQLAARLGISQPRVSAMERGVGPVGPTYLLLKRVAKACGVPWSLETGLGSATEYGRLDVGLYVHSSSLETDFGSDLLRWETDGGIAREERPKRGTNARLVEEVLQSNAPRALRPAEIRKAVRLRRK